ncbi:MAG: 4Fe-4S dicluster domain-containing protein [Dethiobacteria bacterium]|jgi:sulfhydrogenase subunit beta (sulfur reductase)|nr:4Fe-4S binding protein [Bacillota bacterium]
MKKLKKEKLTELWSLLAERTSLYLPVDEGGSVNFLPWEKGMEVDLDALNSTIPPKSIFFQQTEVYLQYTTEEDGLKFEEITPQGPAVLFGVRPCDLKGIQLLDNVFLQEPEDSLYKQRRLETTIVALTCTKPDSSCFCTLFDIDPGAAPGADLLATDLGEEFVFTAQSEKGESLLEAIATLLEDAEADSKAVEEVRRQAKAAVPTHGLDVEGLKEKLDSMFDDPIWGTFYRRCLGCGTCTYLCPTCHCFDIQDHTRGEEGLRFRCWDSCMFGEFTLMASGHNPRPTQKERVRNRFLHKLNYYPKNFESYACVGCGRCVRKCPVNLDMIEVIKALGGVTSGSC